MKYTSIPSSHAWVASLVSEYAMEVIEEKKVFIKEKLAQGPLSKSKYHRMYVSFTSLRARDRGLLPSCFPLVTAVQAAQQ